MNGIASKLRTILLLIIAGDGVVGIVDRPDVISLADDGIGFYKMWMNDEFEI